MSDNNENFNSENWFRRHVLEKLADLQKGQDRMIETQQTMHESNQTRFTKLVESNTSHSADNAKNFSEIRQDLESMKIVKQVVFAGVGMLLIVILGALVAQVVPNRANPTTYQIPSSAKP